MESLRHRAVDVREAMDDPDCDPLLLERTYRQFAWVNAAISGWRQTYRQRIRPLLSADHSIRLLDVGCGGGDLAVALARWAARDGLQLSVTGIDPDPRAHAFATARSPVADVIFRRAHTSELVAAGERFDLVISNHMLHHLDARELAGLLTDSATLCTGRVLHADIIRSRTGLLLFGAATLPLARTSFIRRDGLTSIRRSYRPAELRTVVPAGWQVEPASPFRYLLSYPAPHG